MAKIPFNFPRRDGTLGQGIAVKMFHTAGQDFIVHKGFYQDGTQNFRYEGYEVSHYRTGLNVPIRIKTGHSPTSYYGLACIEAHEIYSDPRTIAEAVTETKKLLRNRNLQKRMRENLALAKVVNL